MKIEDKDSFFCSEELKKRVSKESLYDTSLDEELEDDAAEYIYSLSTTAGHESVELFLLNFERDSGSARFTFSYRQLQDFVFFKSIEDYVLRVYALKSDREIAHNPVLLKINLEQGIITLVCPCND